MMEIWKEFREFAIKGNALDLAVGVIIGAAFGQVVNSIVNDLFNPVLSLIIGQVNFQNLVIHLPAGNVMRFGSFITAAINFVLVSLAIFAVIKQMNRFRRKPVTSPNTKECAFCKTQIHIHATRCPHCTSEIK